MKHKINWDSGGVFAVPDAAADCLKLASGKAVKVLLYIMRFRTDENMCSFIGISEEDAEDAITYWENVGILVRDDSEADAADTLSFADKPQNMQAAAAADPGSTADSVKQPHSVDSEQPVRYPTDVIAAKINESEEIRNGFEMISASLGQLLGYDRQCSFMWIYEHLGLSMEVIIMLVNYSVKINKRSMRDIVALAKEWANEEIDSPAKADAKILALDKARSYKSKVLRALYVDRRLTAKENAIISGWGEHDVPIDLILNAYERNVNATGNWSFPYMNTIIMKWAENGIRTNADADEYCRTHPSEEKRIRGRRKNYPARQQIQSSPSSFDIDLIMEHAKNVPSSTVSSGAM